MKKKEKSEKSRLVLYSGMTIFFMGCVICSISLITKVLFGPSQSLSYFFIGLAFIIIGAFNLERQIQLWEAGDGQKNHSRD